MFNSTQFRTAFTGFAAAISCGLALAAPVHYQESRDGDLRESFLNPVTIQLDVGSNTVSGSVKVDETVRGVYNSDLDSFKIDLGPGLLLTNIRVKMTDVIGNIQYAYWAINGIDPGRKHLGVFTGRSTAETSEAEFPLVGEAINKQSIEYSYDYRNFDQYVFATNGLGLNLGYDFANVISVSNYVFTFDVVRSGLAAPNDVPEPASLALVGLGLAGLVVARKRKPSAA